MRDSNISPTNNARIVGKLELIFMTDELDNFRNKFIRMQAEEIDGEDLSIKLLFFYNF